MQFSTSRDGIPDSGNVKNPNEITFEVAEAGVFVEFTSPRLQNQLDDFGNTTVRVNRAESCSGKYKQVQLATVADVLSLDINVTVSKRLSVQ